MRRAAVVLAIGLVTGCGGEDGAEGPERTPSVCPSNIEWRDCAAGLRCATLELPVDYENPSLGTVSIEIGGALAAPSKRLGAVLMNYGGPGAPGVSQLQASLPLYQAALPDVFEKYDAISFDPRGIPGSTSLDCGAPIDHPAGMSLPLDLEDDAAWNAVKIYNEKISAACRDQADPHLISRIDSDSVARDMDCIRHALGDEQISYFGVSYGSYLGAKYATLFPQRLRAVVLDSVTGLPSDMLEVARRWGKSWEAALVRFFTTAGGDATYAFHGGEGESAVAAAYDELFASRRGVATTATDLGEYGFVSAVMLHLRNGAFGPLAQALAKAESGDFTDLRKAAGDFQWEERTRDPRYWAISVLDRGCPKLDEAELRAQIIEQAAGSRGFGAYWGIQTTLCLSWQVEPAHPVVRVSAPTAPPFLLAVGEKDPAAPAEYATEIEQALGNGSHVITYLGEGHAYYGRNTGCFVPAYRDFLLDPSKPPAVSSCD
jgi:pimeloyl-ACP methyl ester carboxylesterase